MLLWKNSIPPIPFYNKYHPQEDFGLDAVENWKGPRR